MPEPPTVRSGNLCYVEIPALDVHESADFSERTFGWNSRVRKTDRPAFDDTPGEVSGAFVVGRSPAAEQSFLLAAAAADAVIAAGGEIMLPVGQYGGDVLGTFRDPGGNVMGIFQQPGLADAEAR